MKRSVEIVMPGYFPAFSPEDHFYGGTEEYVIETAHILEEKGYRVSVYLKGYTGIYEGVEYLPITDFRGEDIVLSLNERPPHMGKKNLLFSNHLQLKAKDHQDFDTIISPSKWHAENILGWEKVKVIYHACWPKQLEGGVKIPKSCLYSSSPDRGLDLLLDIWPEVYANTGAHLTVTYGGDTDLPGVTCTGPISHLEMNELYKKSQYWVHPCTGVEAFCISGYKAQVAKCIPVFIPTMALSETIAYGVRGTPTNFQDVLISAIQYPMDIPNLTFPSWLDVTNQLEELF